MIGVAVSGIVELWMIMGHGISTDSGSDMYQITGSAAILWQG